LDIRHFRRARRLRALSQGNRRRPPAIDDLDPVADAEPRHAPCQLVNKHSAPQQNVPQERKLGGRAEQKIDALRFELFADPGG
jgi:hypothetical protein